jgi:hypothetical protein
LKSKLLKSQNDYKCLLEKFETFANLNCELTTKIEQLESKAPSSTTDDNLVKKNENLKAHLLSSLDVIENLLDKMEILSIHNNERTTKLESIGRTLGEYLVEIPKIIKKDASTSCFDLIHNTNPCNQVPVKNVDLLCREHFHSLVEYAGVTGPPYLFDHYVIATDVEDQADRVFNNMAD